MSALCCPLPILILFAVITSFLLRPYWLLVTLGFVLLSACSKPKVERQHIGLNIDSAYMMYTKDVDMLVSDSGLTKYRLTSPVWIIYDREDRKEWLFPDSLRMWSVDSLQPGNQLVAADSAIFYVPQEEWVLIGNVRIHGLKGEKLYTQRLHWQRREKRLFSNDTTYFYTDGKELRGNRFEAKDDLSQYSIYNNSGNFEVDKRMLDNEPIPQPNAPSIPSVNPAVVPKP